MKLRNLLFLVFLSLNLLAGAATYQFVPGLSTLTAIAPKSGFLFFSGGDYELEAETFTGFIEWGTGGLSEARIEISAPISELRFVNENLSDEERTALQEDLNSQDVLAPKSFPAIQFFSTNISKGSSGQIMIAGKIMMRGFVVPVSIPARMATISVTDTIRVSGSTSLNLEDFGIDIKTAANGKFSKAKEVEIRFDLMGKANLPSD